MDVGVPSVRRRYTAGVIPFSGAMHMTVAQRNLFVSFYDENEARRFNFPAQDGSDDIWECRFTAPPEEEWLVAKSHWQVSLALELMPGGVTAPPDGGWLLVSGVWDDVGAWDDAASWADA